MKITEMVFFLMLASIICDSILKCTANDSLMRKACKDRGGFYYHTLFGPPYCEHMEREGK